MTLNRRTQSPSLEGTQTRNIVIAGDLILDYHLVQYPVVPSYNREQLRQTVLHRQPGGAWYLREMIELACSDLNINARCAPFTDESNFEPRAYVNQSYTVWALYQRNKSVKDQVWRINKFLGYQSPAKGTQLLKVKDDIPNPDVLVLDDLGLGFRDRPALWPQSLKRMAKPKSIVMKTVAPLGDGLLWKHLLNYHADRLTVVARVKDLRLRRATISSSLSWDSTIEEIVEEFENGLSAQNLALCRRVVIHFEDAGAALFTRQTHDVQQASDNHTPRGRTKFRLDARVRLQRFIYHPEELEGTWLTQRPGNTYGTSSITTAAIVRHELESDTYPICTALTRSLSAMKVSHTCGGGGSTEFIPGIASDELREVFHPPKSNRPKAPGDEIAVVRSYNQAYCTAFIHSILSDKQLRHQPASKSNLLQDLTGIGFHYVEAKATDVVVRGWEQALKFVPRALYGKYLTVDRDEIERINAIRSMILSYQSNGADRQPLAIAVFGPPGSGKSFAIKQLASELFTDTKSILEFNLSQFSTDNDLHTAFHKVRDASVQGQTPLVFWDEFDSEKLKWLKEFLVPLQDAKFQAGSHMYPFGKSIFIFAGGTCYNFESFDKSRLDRGPGEDFRAVKGPDFVSRLRGFVNIKGPNPLEPYAPPPTELSLIEASPAAVDKTGQPANAHLDDLAHLIRRGILLRSALERYHSHLIDARTKFALISPSVIRGFLRVEKFLHGARSLESVVNMSALTEATYFGVAELPSPDLLRLHVTQDFLQEVTKGQMQALAIESLAEEYFEQHRKSLPQAKSVTATRRKSADEGGYAGQVQYAELTEPDKEESRRRARLLPAKLYDLGYRIIRRSLSPPSVLRIVKFSEEELQSLMRMEHDIWLREKLLRGYERGAKNDDALLLHKDIVPFETLSQAWGDADRVVAENIPRVLWNNGYALEKI